jgi:hypothetical protein
MDGNMAAGAERYDRITATCRIRCNGCMPSDPASRNVQRTKEGVVQPTPSARKWQISAAPAFLNWRDGSGVDAAKMSGFASAVHDTVVHGWWPSALAEIAPRLPEALRSCDSLSFDDDVEVRAYAALHLVDRYGRVLQVLEYLFSIGRFPLRHGGVTALEVGSGPAPALYAIRDFYDDLVRWPGRGAIWSTGRLQVSDALDRAPGWDRFMHLLSEQLIVNGQATPPGGQLSFGRTLTEFSGLDIRAIHSESFRSRAAGIEAEFDRADEPISWATAVGMAYDEGTSRPSAYDLIFVPNFFTSAEAPQVFETELRRLMQSLTPGGVFVVLSGTADQYVGIASAIDGLARRTGLTAISPPEPLEANVDQARRVIVAEQVRRTVAEIRAACSQDGLEMPQGLPRDIIDSSITFTLPKFRVIAFVNQRPPRK